ncbi:MAG: uncharacterized membrane-anchored protein YitT (DUF2179 family) [Pseudoalteromonas distincta]|jgi:uncharacterized membrane-anchored protein YitT (DUF2179 family)
MSTSNTVNWRQLFSLSSIMYTALGVLCAVTALKGFMMPNHLLDGGVTGFSILAHEITHYNISIFLVLFNLPFIFIGYKKMGINFAIQVLLAVCLLAILMNIIDVPKVTDDMVLIAVFGGILMGLAVGFVIRAGGVIDGFEILAHYTTKKIGFSSSEIILLTNTILFLGAAFIFGIEPAMYSILTYFTAIKTADYVVDGFEEFTAITIISKEHETIKSLLVNEYKKGISVYKGERGYLPGQFEVKADCDIVMAIVTRLEVHKLKEAITDVDPEAFFYVQRIKEVGGGIVKRKKGH